MRSLKDRVESEVGKHLFNGNDDKDRRLVETLWIKTNDLTVHRFDVNQYAAGWRGFDLLISLEEYPDIKEASYFELS